MTVTLRLSKKGTICKRDGDIGRRAYGQAGGR
jgi:hypothetical protein